MKIDLSQIKSGFYFVDKVLSADYAIIEYGILVGVTPKYNFKDSYGVGFKREENLLFDTLLADGTPKAKVVNNEALVFETLEDARVYCQMCKCEPLFGWSVVMKEKQRENNL